jgi:cyclophilin family peptidyl-prolyl cis-trans isomerase
MWKKKAKSALRKGPAHSQGAPEALMETLEPRAMLYLGPMMANPPYGLMENTADTVVRVDTNQGYFDVELFDSTAPNTVNNFLRYVRSGRLDETFFQSLAGGMLRGGAYRFIDGQGLTLPPTDAPVANEFSRSNLARTVAMWKPAGDPNGARNQFFINLQDNPANNTTNGGYTVFGKVINGWNVVQAIAALAHPDLDQQLTGSNPNPGAFDSVPVTAGFNGTPTENTLVKLVDIDATKPVANGRFYENQYVYPEGFRSGTTLEKIMIANLAGFGTPGSPGYEPDGYNGYQVLLHFENGDRDAVIFTGALAPRERRELVINNFNAPTYNPQGLVRPGVGYSVEVRSMRAMAVSFQHRDFNVQLGEEFIMAPRFAEGALRTWNFGGAEKGPGFKNYVLWQNLKDQTITVNVGIYPESAPARFFAYQVKPFRRLGIAIQDLPNIADGKFSVQVSASGPIAAAMSTYNLDASNNFKDGGTMQGGMNGGGAVGVLAGARIPSGGDSHIDLFYTAGSPAAITVNFTFVLSDGTVIPGAVVPLTSAQRFAHLDVSQMAAGLPTDEYFSIRYNVTNGVTPVTATYRTEEAGDISATVFQTAVTRTAVFADGYTDPTIVGSGMQETYSVFNPYSDQSSVFGFNYQVLFHFSDGTSLFWKNVASLDPWNSGTGTPRIDIRPQDSAAVPGQTGTVWDKINSAPAFRFYSVEIIAAPFSLDPSVIGGIVAQRTRLQNSWGQAVTSVAGLDSRLPVLYMNNPEFAPL